MAIMGSKTKIRLFCLSLADGYRASGAWAARGSKSLQPSCPESGVHRQGQAAQAPMSFGVKVQRCQPPQTQARRQFRRPMFTGAAGNPYDGHPWLR